MIPEPCPVCNDIHRRGIEELSRSPHGIKRVAMFYELDPDILEHHLKNHMEDTK